MLAIFKSHYKSFSKFTVVGGINTVIDFSVFFYLFEILGYDRVVSHICAFFVAVVNSFVFNSLWTFKNLKRDKFFRQMFGFLLISVIGLILSTITIYVVGFWFDPYIAKLAAMFSSFSWNYIGSCVFVFKSK